MNEAAKEAAKFLKSTLRLPSSKFPPRSSPADLAKYLSRCTDDLYAWQRSSRPAQNTFILHDGPPYANGDLHVGHALNKITKDIICRTKLAEGRRIDYVPGWDCHGLPIELKALEKHGWKRGQGVDAVAIRAAARKFAFGAVQNQMKGFKSWGVMSDWDKHWKTMDKEFELRQLAVFRAMTQRGLIYRRNKPVYWSPSSGTALAEAEVDYKNDHVSTTALIKFRLQGNLEYLNASVVIWTTTPWTIPANQAIAVSRSIEYSLVDSKSYGKLVVGSSRIQYLQEQIGETVNKIDTVQVEDLLTSTYSNLPEFGNDGQNRPIIHADFVKDDSGTGLVHCAPGHGHDDYEALQHQIKAGHVKVKAPVDDHGNFTPAAAPSCSSLLTGLYVYGAGNQKMLDLLKQHKVLLVTSKIRHKYPIDWRTKEPVMIRATAQWFADVSSIKEATFRALNEVQFKPESGFTRLRSFVDNRSEWCISRQRAWGVPIPAIYHKETGEAVLSTESVDHVISTIKARGIDAWWSDEPDEPAWIHKDLHAADFKRGTDTMDVWFDSGTSWMFMLNESNPQSIADVYLEGSDQHRGWFQSSLLTSIAYQTSTSVQVPHAPFKTLITHGFTLDANERKMSKSEGNVIAPDQIIAGLSNGTDITQSKTKKRPQHSLGPDALRLWAASNDFTTDVKISDTAVSNIHTYLDKYRITVKLLLGMLQDFRSENLAAYDEMAQLDQIAMLQLYKTATVVRRAYTDYEFYKVITAVNRWVATDLSGFYFEAIKDVIYCDAPSSWRRKSAQTALYHIFQQFQFMLGPVTPVLVEETIEHSPESIRNMTEHPLQQIWQPLPIEWTNDQLSSQIPYIMAINSSVKIAQERARAEKLMGQSLASDVSYCLKDKHQIQDTTMKEVLVVSKYHSLDNDAHHQFKINAHDTEIERSAARIQLGKDLNGDQQNSPDSWIQVQEIIGQDGSIAGFVVVQNPSHSKCARCWKYEVLESQEKAEPPLCERCEEVVAMYKS